MSRNDDDLNDCEPQLKEFTACCIAECNKLNVSIDPFIEETCNALRFSVLRSITICGTKDFRLTNDSVTALVNSLIACKISLTFLSLKYNRISDIGVINICQLILPTNSEMHGIEELDLEGNDIGPTGCEAIQECLVNKHCSLVLLNLSWNPLGKKGGIAIAESLEVNQTLESLLLANCDLNLTTLISLSTNISNNSRISVLVLDRPLLSNPQEDNCDHISQTLAHHQSLEALSLKYSRITDFGVFLLSQELMTNNYLRCLNLECNCIGSRGAEALASYLMQVNRIESLLLSSNNISDDGAIAMASAIRTNKSMKELTLKHNNITVTGLVAIGQSLYKNMTLQYLSLWGNKFDDESSHLFYDIIETRLPYINLKLDVEAYVVDDVHYVAECAL